MLAAGSTISHFQVLEKLGEGGMGVVYKARDHRLNRIVAIKTLTSEAVASDEHLRRFIQEARSASSLNHPNIVTVYEIDTIDELTFIAMEFVEGKTLRDELRAHRMSVLQAVRYGIAISDALSAAHNMGVIHRDVHPGNILVASTGTIKVLDFGLAKLVDPSVFPDGTPTESDTVTIAATQTQHGAIVGTPSYMSPEQAEGRHVDTRTDVFSFGVVLYEMLTGRKPFTGTSSMSTLTAILSHEPAPIPADTGVPRDLSRIVMRCLRKDPARRFQVMSDVKVALEDVKEDLETGNVSGATAQTPARKYVRLALALLAALVLGASGMRLLYRPAGTIGRPRPSTFIRLTSDAGLTTDPAISPDGKLVAYASDRAGSGNLDIWVQQTAGGAPVRLTTDEANERQPSFSPDGTKIVYRSERERGGIYVVSALGGVPVRVAISGFNPQFSPDGQRIAYWTGGQVSVSTPSKIFVAPATGGAAEEIQTGLLYSRHPLWTRDGTQLLFWGASANLTQLDWYAIRASPEQGRARISNSCGVFSKIPSSNGPPSLDVYPRAWLGDEVLFSLPAFDTRDLWVAPISIGKACNTSGAPHKLTDGIESASHPTSSSTQRIAWAAVKADINIWSLAIDAEAGTSSGGAEQLTYGLSPKYRPFLSRNGKRLVFNDGQRIAVRDMATGKEEMITTTAAAHASLTADGSRVVYASAFAPSAPDLYVDDLKGELPEKICQGCGLPPAGWSTDQQKILFDWGIPQWLGIFDINTRTKRELIRQPGRAFTQASFSPDDRFILFLASAGPGRQRVYVVAYGANSSPSDERQWIPITDGQALDSHPRWSPEGRVVYFLSDRDGFRCLWARKVDVQTKHPAGEPFAVYHLHSARRSISNIATVGLVGLGVSRDRIVFNLGESTGNVWMADLH